MSGPALRDLRPEVPAPAVCITVGCWGRRFRVVIVQRVARWACIRCGQAQTFRYPPICGAPAKHGKACRWVVEHPGDRCEHHR